MTLSEFLTKHGISQNAAARAMSITQGHISRIINGEKPMTRDVLRRFELAYMGNPLFLLDVVSVVTRYSYELDQELIKDMS